MTIAPTTKQIWRKAATGTVAPTNLLLDFRPTVDLISSTRLYVCAFLEPFISDPDVVSRIGIATHELLENVLKYATDGRAVTRVELTEDAVLTVETTSEISAERRAGLEEIFAEMADASDAFSYYQLTMSRARHRRHGSGLGLARIWAESEMTLSIAFPGNSVTIRAIANLATAEDS